MNATTKSVRIELNNKYTVTTEELMEILGVGRKTAVEIGRAACAKIVVGKRIIWNLRKIDEYLYNIAA